MKIRNDFYRVLLNLNSMKHKIVEEFRLIFDTNAKYYVKQMFTECKVKKKQKKKRYLNLSGLLVCV